jgi:hypothetical protein
MTRQQIMDTTYQSILRLTRLKAKYDLISPKMAQTQEWRINTAMELEQRIDQIGPDNPGELEVLKPQVDKINALRANERDELEMPMGLRKLKFLRSLWSLVAGRK